MSIKGVGGKTGASACTIVKVAVSSSYKKDWKVNLDTVVMDKLTVKIPTQGASATKNLPHLRGIHLADPN